MELVTAVSNIANMFSECVGSFFVLEEICSICHNEEKIKTLTHTVDLVRGVLSDLQRIQTPTESVSICYKQLREEFLNAEDFLDKVQSLKKKAEVQNTRKRQGEPLSHAPYKMINVAGDTVRRALSALNQAYYAFKEHKEIKEISAQFEAISKNLKSFEVEGKEPSSTSEEMHRDARARGSIVDVTRQIGRDNDKKKIVELLLSSCADESRIPVISVVGIGGMGKTTVAQLVYNDWNWQERYQFAERVWVSDSKQYKLEQLLKHMLKSIDHEATNVDYLAEDQLRDLFVDKIRGKSFFLVLDDVDNENPRSWEQLELLLNQGNRVESRILVTTRSREVTKVVRSSGLIHELKGLSHEDSLELFERFAFQEERRDGISDELVNQIVEKCCGVPLALKVIGTFLRWKDTHKWEVVRDSNSLANVGERNDLMPVLKISYYDLDPTVKQCFSLCAVFPKNSVIPSDILRHLWVTNIHFETAGETLEDVCEKSLRILYNRCFLESAIDSEYGDDLSGNIFRGGRTEFKMHDLMYDLAQEVAGAEICIVGPNLEEEETVGEKIRHLFITDGTPNFQLERYRLRSIIRSEEAEMQNMFSPSFVSKCPFLRVLDLRYCGIENLTDSVGKLIHLRYLYLAGNKFQTLPKSITELINLRHLDLKDCESLTQLPSGMDALISLEVLDLFYCNSLVELPTVILKMTHLKRVIFTSWHRLGVMPSGMGALLPLFPNAHFKVGHPGSSSHAQLEELGPISDLPERFAIVLPKNITSKAATQDGEPFLLNKKRLRHLKIQWESNPRLEEEVPAIHEDILAKLQPSVNLEDFYLHGYQGMMFPPWAAQHGFASVLPNLGTIYIDNCRRCRYLPSLSGLECLTRLALVNLSSLDYIQENLSASPFCLPKLECLELHGLPELKGWCRVLAAGANDNDGEDMRLMLSQSFPCLTTVYLFGCPNFPEPSVLFSLNNPSLPFHFYCDNGYLELPKEKNGSWTMTFSQMKTEVAPRYMTGSLRAVSDRLTGLCIKNCGLLKTVTGLLQHLTGLRYLGD